MLTFIESCKVYFSVPGFSGLFIFYLLFIFFNLFFFYALKDES